MTKRLRRVLLIVVAAFCAGQLAAYPLDGYEETGRTWGWRKADFSPRERSCRPLP